MGTPDHPLNTRNLWSVAFWGCAAAILALSVGPTWETIPTTGWDKCNHLFAYFVLAILGFRAYPIHGAAVLAGVIAYGALLEVLQALLPHRFGEWLDILADALGATIAVAVDRFVRKRFPAL